MLRDVGQSVRDDYQLFAGNKLTEVEQFCQGHGRGPVQRFDMAPHPLGLSHNVRKTSYPEHFYIRDTYEFGCPPAITV